MTQSTENNRNQMGYGSSYRKGQLRENSPHEIKAVLGGQVWMVKPHKDVKTDHPCLWMQAGIVNFKSCNNFFDCTSCKYDHGMQKKVAAGKERSWQDAMRLKPALERVCRHSMTHRIEKRACAYDYQCGSCDFDQYFEECWTPKTTNAPHELQSIKGFDIPVGYYFHNGHTWARIENGGTIRIGLDDFALKLLGQADALDLPLIGKELDMGKPGWGLRRKSHQAEVLSPIDGIIMEVNANVRENPEIANHAPYADGWLFTVRTPDIKKSMKQLMNDTESLSWLNTEVDHLENMIEEVAGPLAADGGLLQADIFGNLPSLGWHNLTQRFLRS